MEKGLLQAGAARTDITPKKSMFLYGYPHVERYSEGTHDPLYASALVLDDGETRLALCAVDLIFLDKKTTAAIRREVRRATGIPEHAILVSCTHTHSGPATVDMISNRADATVPGVDGEYLDFVVRSAADALSAASRSRVPSELALTTADGTGVGGNRRTRGGAADPELPVIAVRDRADKRVFALSTTYCMHPTVLHEDSKLYSADFPGYARMHVAATLGPDVVHLYHTGPAGNQSPRHHVGGNTFDEAKRLGEMLGDRIVDAVSALRRDDYRARVSLAFASSEIALPVRRFPSPADAEGQLEEALDRLRRLRESGAPASEVRTAECDWFGAEERVTLARCAASGEIERVLGEVLPAEVQALRIDDWHFVGLPGELFVEYSLRIKARAPARTFVISLANGELQGYVVTEAAAAEGGYEAANALFPPAAGDRMVEAAVSLIETLHSEPFRESEEGA